MNLPAKIRLLDVSVDGRDCGKLQHASRYTFAYNRDDGTQRPVGLLMPPSQLAYEDTALFPVMDQNLPEGFLFSQLRAAFPKQPITPMHLLALMGSNGIGRLGFRVPDAPVPPRAAPMSREDILASRPDEHLFEKLVHDYLSTGIGIAGIQPKILVPDRSTWAVPNLIVKSASPSYPGIAANEFVCLRAARLAGIEVPKHHLSDSGELLVIERFDLLDDGTRLGFEDIAALMGLQVRDVLADRKYHGSYEKIAQLLNILGMAAQLPVFFEQVAFSIMVRNGDAHLKNFGVLYTDTSDMRIAPMFDVVTTAIYEYSRYAGGPPMEDHTMALKLFSGKERGKVYPSTHDLMEFGARICGVRDVPRVLERLADGMRQSLELASRDARVAKQTLARMKEKWERGFAYAREGASSKPASRKRRTP